MPVNLKQTPSERQTQLVSAKRTKRERSGIHSWHPYYAGYSEAFVDSAINFLQLKEIDTVLDPWGGSGTTSVVASRRGISSINAEINPVMSIFAAAKSPAVLSFRPEIERFFERLNETKLVGSGPDPLEAILSPETARLMRGLVLQIPNHDVHQGRYINCPISAFSMAVFFVTLRRIGGAKKLANPTWLKTYSDKIEVEPSLLRNALQETARNMLDDLEAFYGEARSRREFQVLTCDVRALPILEGAVDAVITSPPYLTRIDYAVSTLPEMMFLGDMSKLEAIRHATMGAPVIKKIDRAKRDVWGRRCLSFLDNVAAHGSKAAKSYYWKNIIQYFMDMEDSLREIMRVMKPHSSGLIVVQSSYFKEHEIQLGEMYVDMCKNLGLRSEIAFREKVKTHMAHVNTKSSIYVKNKVYHEDFVYFEKSS